MKVFLMTAILMMAALTSEARTNKLTILRNGDLYNCNPQTPPPEEDEDWQCSTTESDRTGDLLSFGCKGSTPWACVATVHEDCTERHSGRVKNRSNKEFRGCSASLGDCF